MLFVYLFVCLWVFLLELSNYIMFVPNHFFLFINGISSDIIVEELRAMRDSCSGHMIVGHTCKTLHYTYNYEGLVLQKEIARWNSLV